MQIIKKSVTFEVEPVVVHNPNFWQMVSSGAWEPDTFEVLQKYLSKNCSYLDIGAWVGPTVLFGAQLAKACYAFEPDPVAHAALKRNLELNPHINNVTASTTAVGTTTGTPPVNGKGAVPEAAVSAAAGPVVQRAEDVGTSRSSRG